MGPRARSTLRDPTPLCSLSPGVVTRGHGPAGRPSVGADEEPTQELKWRFRLKSRQSDTLNTVDGQRGKGPGGQNESSLRKMRS